MNKKKTNYTGKVLEYTLKTKIMAETNKLTAIIDSGEKTEIQKLENNKTSKDSKIMTNKKQPNNSICRKLK